jgi:hypothetical protein
VNGTTYAIGGLVGYSINNSITNSFYNSSVNPLLTGIGLRIGGAATVSGLSSSAMKNSANFTGFTFTTTPGATGNNWVIVNADGTLNGTSGGGTTPMLASEYSTTINNAHQLQLMAMDLGASYTLGSNINAAATGNTSDVWANSTFIPIGTYSNPFTGSFNGFGHTISALTINLPLNWPVGLFAIARSGIIKNIGLVGIHVTGYNNVGGLVGISYADISNSYATGSVIGTSSWVGGLVGVNYANISNSYATASVNGTSSVGGLIGVSEGSISNSYTTGSVTGVSQLGGLVGYNTGSISNSYATGRLTGNYNLGGLVGYSGGSITNSYATGSVDGISSTVGGLVGYSWASISNSYATGSVTGLSEVGGLVGYNWASSLISNSYATGGVIGTSSWVGGLVGVNYANISNSYATGSVAGLSGVGGLVGTHKGGDGQFGMGYIGSAGSNATVSNSYATGSVIGNSYVGGLIGKNLGGQGGNGYNRMGGKGGTAIVNTSYATGRVTGSSNSGGLIGGDAPGIAGNSYYGGSGGTTSVSTSYWDTQTSGQSSSAAGTGITSAQMHQQASFIGWNIANTGGSNAIWRIYEGHTAPLLASFLTPLALTGAPDRTVTFIGRAQSGGTTSLSGYGNLLLGAPATGTIVGFFNGYYSTQQGYDLIGGNITINAPPILSDIAGIVLQIAQQQKAIDRNATDIDRDLLFTKSSSIISELEYQHISNILFSQ